ncbi:ankyrin [Annulohypoxylon nitens]|nr:ankyrin [Annulohypoxylon nitens]
MAPEESNRHSCGTITHQPIIMDVPAELLESICKYLDFGDIKRWAYVNRHFLFHLYPIMHQRDSRKTLKAARWACKHGLVNLLTWAQVNGTDVKHRFPPLGIPQRISGVRFRPYLDPPEQFPTLLHMAAYYDQLEIMKSLIFSGADMTIGRARNWNTANFWEPMCYARSSAAVILLMPGVSQDWNILCPIYRMILDWVPLSAIATILDHIRKPESFWRAEKSMIERILCYASMRNRSDIIDLVTQRFKLDNKPPPFLDATCLMAVAGAIAHEALPTRKETICGTINAVLRLSTQEPSRYINRTINHSMFLGYRRHVGDTITTLLFLSMRSFVPVSVTNLFLKLGANPHQRCQWPTHDIFYFRVSESSYSDIMDSEWQVSGTALTYSVAMTLMVPMARRQQGNREKAMLLLKYGAAFETSGYPVSFMLSTVVWPYPMHKVIKGISGLLGRKSFTHLNKYGETHLTSLLSWMSHTPRHNTPHKTSMPIEQWAWSIARLAHALLEIPINKTYLSHLPTDGPNKGLTPIEIINRHDLSAGCFKKSNIYFRCITGVFAISDVLLHHGSSVNIKDQDGVCLLHLAAKRGDTMRVLYLISRGAEVHSVDRQHNTALHYACQIDVNDREVDNKMGQTRRRIEIIRKLVWHGADVNAKNKDGITPLFFACQSLDYKLVEELLRVGAKVLLDNNGRSLKHAVKRAKGKYEDYQRGAEGALSRILFKQGEADYVYDPRKRVLDVLEGDYPTNETGIIGRDIEPPSKKHFLRNCFRSSRTSEGATVLKCCEEISWDMEFDCSRIVRQSDFEELDDFDLFSEED